MAQTSNESTVNLMANNLISNYLINQSDVIMNTVISLGNMSLDQTSDQLVMEPSSYNNISSNSESSATALNETTRSDSEKLAEFMNVLRSQVLIEKIIYTSLFVIGSLGNSFVLYNLFQPRFKAKMNYLVRHLAVADLMVIFLTIGVELIWRITIKWETGEFGCKIVQFWRIFPLYLTSLMMICISLDRFYAFVFPLTIFKSKERNFFFIITSYIVSFLASIPQVTTLIRSSLLCGTIYSRSILSSSKNRVFDPFSNLFHFLEK